MMLPAVFISDHIGGSAAGSIIYYKLSEPSSVLGLAQFIFVQQPMLGTLHLEWYLRDRLMRAH